MEGTNWRDKLDEKELKHIREECMRSWTDVERNVLHQNKQSCPCWQCVSIGEKLGIKVDLVVYCDRVRGERHEYSGGSTGESGENCRRIKS